MDAAAKIKELEKKLTQVGYLPDDRTALAAFLAVELDKPLLVEGPAGVGKTDLARALAEAQGRELIRLQCYEGLDEGKALYEWDYAKQILYTQLLRDAVAKALDGATSIADAANQVGNADAAFFSERFLLARPLLKAITSEKPVVLLIDEVDRADPEFEAFLLEILADRQVTIPELGTLKAKHAPLIILTTNGTRDMTDALRRRCLHVFVDYPPPSREIAILEKRVAGLSAALAADVAKIAERLRKMDLRKAPSISESIDWGRALVVMGANAIDKELLRATLGVLLKYDDDREKAENKLDSLLSP
ncbi:MAG: MoxR family ATPase [Polyangiaceae bacterium]